MKTYACAVVAAVLLLLGLHIAPVASATGVVLQTFSEGDPTCSSPDYGLLVTSSSQCNEYTLGEGFNYYSVSDNGGATTTKFCSDSSCSYYTYEFLGYYDVSAEGACHSLSANYGTCTQIQGTSYYSAAWALEAQAFTVSFYSDAGCKNGLHGGYSAAYTANECGLAPNGLVDYYDEYLGAYGLETISQIYIVGGALKTSGGLQKAVLYIDFTCSDAAQSTSPYLLDMGKCVPLGTNLYVMVTDDFLSAGVEAAIVIVLVVILLAMIAIGFVKYRFLPNRSSPFDFHVLNPFYIPVAKGDVAKGDVAVVQQ